MNSLYYPMVVSLMLRVIPGVALMKILNQVRFVPEVLLLLADPENGGDDRHESLRTYSF